MTKIPKDVVCCEKMYHACFDEGNIEVWCGDWMSEPLIPRAFYMYPKPVDGATFIDFGGTIEIHFCPFCGKNLGGLADGDSNV